MPEPVTILSQYPLSIDYRSAISQQLGSEPGFLTLGELRRMSPGRVIATLRGVPAGRTLIGLEDPTSVAALPMLRMVASATPSPTLGIVGPDLSLRRFDRISQVGDALRFAAACVSGHWAMFRASFELNQLAAAPRVVPSANSAANRVSYLNTNLWFGQKAGGSVGHVSGVANGLLENGLEVDYLTVGGRLLIREPARVLELTPPREFGLPYETNLYRFDRDFEAQALPLIDPPRTRFLYQRVSMGNFTGVRLSRTTALPLVSEYNGSETWAARNWGNRPLTYERVAQAAELQSMRHAHVVVTVSDVLRDELLERGIEADRIVTYPNCIDPAVFDPARFAPDESADLRRRLGLRSDACVATFLGTFGLWHGAEMLAQAIRSLCESARGPRGLQFLLVGDGLRLRAVRDILDTPACHPHVRYTGLVPQEDAPAYLAASDILVAPHVPNPDGTRFFGSPTKLFEYMAMGKAIVASDLDQIGDVLRNSFRLGEADLTPQRATAEQRLAVLLRPGDAEELAEALALLAESEPLRAALGANARREALQRYTWKQHVDAILERIRAVAGA